MRAKDFAVFDADSHVVEPPALWEKNVSTRITARSASMHCGGMKGWAAMRPGNSPSSRLARPKPRFARQNRSNRQLLQSTQSNDRWTAFFQRL
jgi:hypothetical protein